MTERRPSDRSRPRRRADLVAHLYGELPPEEAAALERELAADAELRAEARALAEAAAALDAWPAPDDCADARELARAAVAAAREQRAPRLRRARPVLAGVAAALVAFLALVALGAEVRAENGRATLSVHLPWSAPAPPAPSLEHTLAPTLAAVEQRATDAVLAAATQAIALLRENDERRHAEWGRRQHEERLALLQTVDRALAEERRVLAGWLDALGRGAARADRDTREAVARLAAHVQDR